jgi:hypothetical protein
MWLDAKVAIDDDGPWPAQISPYRWNGWAVPRFTREVMEQMVPYFNGQHEHYKAQGSPDACPAVMWDGDNVIMHEYAWPDEETGQPYTVTVIEPDEEGRYHFGDGWTWQTIAEDWPERDAVRVRLAASQELFTLAYAIRAAGGSLETYAAKQLAVEAYETALSREGVPTGHLRDIGGELYIKWREVWRVYEAERGCGPGGLMQAADS